MKLCRMNILDVKLSVKQHSTPGKERSEQWEELTDETAKETHESQKPFEDAIAAKQKIIKNRSYKIVVVLSPTTR